LLSYQKIIVTDTQEIIAGSKTSIDSQKLSQQYIHTFIFFANIFLDSHMAAALLLITVWVSFRSIWDSDKAFGHLLGMNGCACQTSARVARIFLSSVVAGAAGNCLALACFTNRLFPFTTICSSIKSQRSGAASFITLCSRSGAIIFVHVDQQPKLTTIEYISTSE
jgi:hypothetical protein